MKILVSLLTSMTLVQAINGLAAEPLSPRKDMSPWMQQFVPMIEDHLARMKTIEP